MSFLSDFGDMLPQTAFISQKLGTDDYNQPTYGSYVSYQVRVVYGQKLVRNMKGDLVPSSGSMWLYSRRQLGVEDKFEFLSDAEPSPAGYTQLFPLALDSFPDENGHYFNKVYFR